MPFKSALDWAFVPSCRSCPAFINPTLVVSPIARSHGTATISSSVAPTGWT